MAGVPEEEHPWRRGGLGWAGLPEGAPGSALGAAGRGAAGPGTRILAGETAVSFFSVMGFLLSPGEAVFPRSRFTSVKTGYPWPRAASGVSAWLAFAVPGGLRLRGPPHRCERGAGLTRCSGARNYSSSSRCFFPAVERASAGGGF